MKCPLLWLGGEPRLEEENSEGHPPAAGGFPPALSARPKQPFPGLLYALELAGIQRLAVQIKAIGKDYLRAEASHVLLPSEAGEGTAIVASVLHIFRVLFRVPFRVMVQTDLSGRFMPEKGS